MSTTPWHAQKECTSIMACAGPLAARAWSMTCDGWDTICWGLEPIGEMSPSSDYVFCKILTPLAAWLLHMLNPASIVWHLHQRNLSRVRHTHDHTSRRILDAIGDALDKLKRSEASVAAAKLMVALAVLNTPDTTQAWACLLLELPLYHDHLADTALKAPSAAQQVALWATSAGLHLLDATQATASIAGRAADMRLLPFLRRPSASTKAGVGTSKAHAAATSLKVTGALQRLDKVVNSLLHLASSSAAATAADAPRSVAQVTSARPSTHREEPHHLWNLACNPLESPTSYLTPALATAEWCMYTSATSAAGATTIGAAATLLGTALARGTIQVLSLSAVVSIAFLACAATAAHVTAWRRTQGTCLILLYAFAAAWQYSNHFNEAPSADVVAEAMRMTASAAADAITNHLTMATSTTAAGAFATPSISIAQVTDHHEGLGQPQQDCSCRSWGGGIERRLQWEEDAFECSEDRTIRFLGPGLRRLSKLGPKAPGHKKNKKPEPTRGLDGVLLEP